MRAFTLILVLSLSPASSLAQDEFDEVEQLLGEAPIGGVWNLDDGIGNEDVPWDDFDAALSYLPRGLVFAGLELRGGVIPTRHSMTEERPQVELSGFLDFRYHAHSPFHMRFGLAVSYEPSRSQNFGGGTHVTTSAVGVRLRLLPLAVDLGQYIALRAGPDIGVQIAPGPAGARALFAAGAQAQIVARLLEGRLEIGAYGGFQTTGVSRLERPNSEVVTSAGGETYVPDATLGLSTGYLF